MRDARDIVRRILLAEGALVEPIEPEGLELIATPRLQQALAIPEVARLGFGAAEWPEGAARVSLESDWMNRLDAVMGDRGRCLSLTAWSARLAGRPHDPEEMLAKHCVFDNSTHRFAGSEPVWTRYLLLSFKTTAVSDEKREDLISVCVNESNGASADHLTEPILDDLEKHGGDYTHLPTKEKLDAPWTEEEARLWCAKLLPARIRARLQPFLSGMERRMAKDADRLHAYCSALRNETMSKIEENRKKPLRDEAANKHLELRMEAAEREYHSKLADLRRKYAMTVEVKLAQAVRLAMPIHRIRGTLLRRKGTRPIHLDWNALSKRLDSFLCEGCGGITAKHVLCDDRLHILCPTCLAGCSACGAEYCRACHPRKCPRCNAPAAETVCAAGA